MRPSPLCEASTFTAEAPGFLRALGRLGEAGRGCRETEAPSPRQGGKQPCGGSGFRMAVVVTTVVG